MSASRALAPRTGPGPRRRARSVPGLGILAVLGFASTAGAQEPATMFGLVVSGPDSVPVAEASVFIRLERRGTLTDFEGRFLLLGVEGRKVVLEVQEPCHHAALAEVVVDGTEVEVPPIALVPSGRCDPWSAPKVTPPKKARSRP